MSADSAASLEAARVQLLAAEREAVAAANSRDAQRLAAVYADDAILSLGNAAAITGQAAICEWIDRFVKNREVAFRYESIRVEVSRSADLGYTMSRYEVTLVRPDGSRFEEKGRWVQIWRRSSQGAWKLAVEISSPGPPQHR